MSMMLNNVAAFEMKLALFAQQRPQKYAKQQIY